MKMLMGGKCTETAPEREASHPSLRATQEQPSSIDIPKDCPYGAEGCPKVDEMRLEIAQVRKENNVIWKELNKVEQMVSANSASLSSLKWLVFLLVCGATGINVMI